MLNKVKTLFNNKKGMTLVEVLVALTILALVLMLSTPLFISSFNAIKTSGDTSIKVYNQSGLMQRILGNTKTGDDASNSGYNIDAVNVPLKVSGDGKTFTANTPAHLVVSDPTNLNAGYESLLTDSISTCFQVFPRELTDDFKEAYLTVAAVGTTFVDDPATSSAYKLYLNHDPSKPLVRGTDYDIKRVESSDPDVKNKVLTVILYGGKKINYSNSPLTFKYGTVTQDISISAPSMIMVGDKDSSGKYYYYVSRGETTDDGKLIVLQREMNDTDKKTNKTTKLTSAMNDVEWVPAENADDYAKVGGKKYGYYIMGGDNGQIRRFWQDATTGNYYWGGDYTYYTDINLNRADSDVSSYYKATNTYSTSVSYKFLARRSDKGYGLVNGTKGANSTTKRDGNAAAYVKNMYTVTALDGSTESQKAYFYGSDGKILHWYQADPLTDSKTRDDYNNGPTLSRIGGTNFENTANNILKVYSRPNLDNLQQDYTTPNGQKVRSLGWYWEWNYEDLNWLKVDQNSYYDVYGITSSNISSAGATKESYPITITSVDAIVLGESTKTSYANDVTQYNYDYSDGGAKMAGLSYPSKTYMLYCGYIPSAYDAWSAVAEKNKETGFASGKDKEANRIAIKEAYTMDKNKNNKWWDLSSNLSRVNKQIKDSGVEQNALWLGTFGITPYYTSGTSGITSNGQLAYTSLFWWNDWFTTKVHHDYVYFFPYTNVKYAVSGKFADDTVNNTAFNNLFTKTVNTATIGGLTYNKYKDSGKEQSLTNGKIVDITCSYLSHPFALHIAANPSSGGKVFNVSNDKGNGIWSYYYSNRRETVTILDSASTRIPNGENDIPVSLAVGYGQGGTATFVETGATLFGAGANYPTFINNIMDIGIVFLRAGEGYLAKQQANGMSTEEYEALDQTGYKLDSESNYFHQFYYICSKLPENTSNALGKDTYYQVKDEYQFLGNETIGGLVGQNHIGNMYGAKYWENNRHIIYRSTDGGAPDRNDHNTSDNGNFNYLRSHPMTDCKVTSVAWGSTWNNYPEAMWGTDNGTVLSWWVDLNGVNASGAKASDYNDQSVEAEFQSYQWIDNCEGKRLHTNGSAWTQTVGAHENFTDNKDGSGDTIKSVGSYDYKTENKTISRTFRTFLDKASQENKLYEKGYGFVSTLKSINDVAYANDYWVAVGNQATTSPYDADSNKEKNLRGNLICPALYCGNKTLKASDGYYGTYGGEEGVKAYTGDGQGGSWVNVRYWVDRVGDGVASESNSTYFWKAVKISNTTSYNIVQINNLNGVWYATGYYDANNNEQYDQGERAVICWASDPLAACDSGVTGCWTEAVQFYKTPGSSGKYKAMSASEVGAINSVACRDDL